VTLQKQHTKIKNKCQVKVNDGIILPHDTASLCDQQNAGPTECHVMEGVKTFCIQPGIIAM
jgi:hypothetical protein